MRERLIKKHPLALVSSASHNGVLLCTTCVYLVSLDYEISLPHPSPYHTSQQAADLVFEPTMKRSQKREKVKHRTELIFSQKTVNERK